MTFPQESFSFISPFGIPVTLIDSCLHYPLFMLALVALLRKQTYPASMAWCCLRFKFHTVRFSGVHVVNYWDNWLLMAQSEDVLCSHRDLLINQLRCLRAQSQLKSHLQRNVCSLSECESQLCLHASPSYTGLYTSYHELACDVRRMEVSLSLMAAASAMSHGPTLHAGAPLCLKICIPAHTWH